MESRGASGTTVLLTVVAVAMVGGFMFWLHQRSESLETDVQPVMEDTAATSEEAVGLEALRRDVAAAVGRPGDIDSVQVAQRLSRALFTIQLDTASTFPVFLNTDVLQRNPQVYGGDRVSLQGRLYILNDSITQSWVRQGAVDSAAVGDVPSVGAFLLADSLEVH